MLSPEEMAQLNPQMDLDDLWVAGLNDDQHNRVLANKLARLQWYVIKHCQASAPKPKERPRDFFGRLGL